MNILIMIDKVVGSALVYWLQSQGHTTHSGTTIRCQKLVLDYANLQPYLWSQQPLPGHWPSPEHWLLLDAYLRPTQLIAAMHLGCRHISLAPIQAVHLGQWLNTQPQIEDLACKWPDAHGPQSDIDTMLLPFIQLIMQGLWSEAQQLVATEAMSWRNLALQSSRYQRLNKTHKLDTIEFAQLAYHTLAGENWLQQHARPKAALIARQHHEHWDGSGYPMSIAGPDICLEARLAKLYDSYLGLRKAKTYAQANDHATSINKLTYGDGYLQPSQFDPHLLERFLNAEQAIATLYSLSDLAN